MSRPKRDLTRMNLLLPTKLVEELRLYAERCDMTMTDYVKRAVREALKKDTENERTENR